MSISLLSVKPVFLASDVLIYILIASLVMFFYQILRSPLSRARWRGVFQSAAGMSAFVVILFYVLVAFLDSIHYREPLPVLENQQVVHYSQDVRSVLDYIFIGVRQQTEKTYSSPFSLELFTKENMQDEEGVLYRDYPELKHAGKHLNAPEEQVQDIVLKSLTALLFGLIISAVMAGGHTLWRKRKQQSNELPWWSAYLTITALVMAGSWAIGLSHFYHIAGTNIVGVDVFYQSIKAIRTGVLIGTLATLLTLPIAIILGISAGYFRGWVDDTVQYIYTTLSSIPGILLIAASVLLIDVYIELHPESFSIGAVRADFKFLALCFILGMTSWTGLCRLLRAETLKVSQLDYVQAAHAFGVPNMRIIFKHILPNVTHIILIAMVLDFSVFVLAEAVLSYIGVGVDPSMASWGNMINEARSELSRDPVVWWPVLSAFVLMFVLVLAANVFSDRVRDAFDPRG